ncbi:MAG: endolytic transglycosylase MltG [Alphaproteobacteria bacterium]
MSGRAYEDDYDDYEEEPRRASFWSQVTTISSWFVTLLAVGLGAVFLLIIDTQRPGPPSPTGAAETTIVVPRGVGVAQIGQHLQAEGVIRNAMAFRAAVVIYGRGRSLKAGEYSIPSGASSASIIEKVSAGHVVLHPVTVPEGWTSAMIVDMLANADFLDGDTPPVPEEGALLPETYRVERGAERAEVLHSMQQASADTMRELWATRAQNLPFKTPREALILASVVEKETGIQDERPHVAAVFVNRLRKGMKLESDPTVIYGVSQGKPLGRGLLRSELDKDTPYNTYKRYGLPPTPIANPGKAAIEAVLNPMKSNDLYFVADGTGGHAFASTLSEHQKNVDRWRSLERLRGTQ